MQPKRKYKKSYVISLRISDQELDDIKRIMHCMQITRVSDLMRQAVEVVRDDSASRLQEPLEPRQLPMIQTCL